MTTNTEKPMLRPVCGDCGGLEVEAIGTARWHIGLQRWVWSGDFGYGTCPDCGSTEVKIRMEPVP